jgi:hypothetical protein
MDYSRERMAKKMAAEEESRRRGVAERESSDERVAKE